MKRGGWMSSFTDYIERFFGLLVDSGITSGYREAYDTLESALYQFIEKENTDNAFSVYSSFFDIYRVTSRDKKTVFLDLVDMIKQYEENAASLTDKQRDHFIHSVNVFIMGISIYIMNKTYRSYFDTAYDDRTYIPNPVDEFLYIWGLASLIHDVGYPVEIATNQVNRFTRTISSIDAPKPRIKGSFVFTYFDELRSIVKESWEPMAQAIRRDILFCNDDVDIFDSYVLLALRVSEMVEEPYGRVLKTVNEFTDKMVECQFVDHGFYSALILLKWMGCTYQFSDRPPKLFYSYVVDAAAAILLHNFYRGTFIEPPYSKPPLDPQKAPLAFLLILCDECQDWNRRAYGFKDLGVVRPENGRMIVSADELHLDYRTSTQRLTESYTDEKLELIYKLVDVRKIFTNGINMICTCERSADILLEEIKERESAMPRPLFENILGIASSIHSMYNEERLKEFPDRPLEYPTWESLPQDLRYSNITQARDIPEKLRYIGYTMVPVEEDGVSVESFTPEEETILAMREHDRWVKERKSNGWIFGPVKDVEKRISPYITEWENLPKDIQEYDYQAVRNIPRILGMTGMKICRK